MPFKLRKELAMLFCSLLCLKPEPAMTSENCFPKQGKTDSENSTLSMRLLERKHTSLPGQWSSGAPSTTTPARKKKRKRKYCCPNMIWNGAVCPVPLECYLAIPLARSVCCDSLYVSKISMSHLQFILQSGKHAWLC